MLLGAHPKDTIDKGMRVTVAFNHFGANLVERMPRCRQGTFHIVNNNYQGWGMYAIGGSENPTIFSEGNRFFAPDARFKKEVNFVLALTFLRSIAFSSKQVAFHPLSPPKKAYFCHPLSKACQVGWTHCL